MLLEFTVSYEMSVGFWNALYQEEVVAIIFHIMKKVKVKVAQSCLTCNPVDHTVHGILQTRTLEWVAVPFSRGNSEPGDWTQIFRIAEPLDRCKILPNFPTFIKIQYFSP